MIDIFRVTSRVRHRAGAIWARHVETVRIVRELDDSSDRVLADIGIARGDVDAVARRRFGRP